MIEDTTIYIDPDAVLKAQKAAEKEVSHMTTDQWKYLRRLCKTDLWFLTYGVLGYNKLSEGLHGHLTSWMLRNRAARFRLMLLPRGHYKSTISTVADSIRIVLPDDVGDQPWPENLGPNCRLAIIHEGLDQSSKWVMMIQSHFLSNSLLMGLFPECVPSIREHTINRYALELPRSGRYPESTIEAMSVGGKSQGKHYNYLKCDDLVGDKARESKTEMDSAIQWFDGIQPYFVEFTRDRLDLIGTRWAVKDLYSHVINTYGPAILKYIRPAIEDGQPIFPEAFTLEALAQIKRTNPQLYSAYYDNDPENSQSGFRSDWLRFYKKHPSGHIIYYKGEEKVIIHPQQCDICILLDPAMVGRGGLLVTAEHTDENIFVLEALKHNWSPPELCSLVFSLVQKYRPRTVAIEEVLFSGLFKHWFDTEMKMRGIRFHITPVKPLAREKRARVRGLTNYFSAGRIWFLQEQLDLIQEYKEFNDTDDFHMLDAFGYGPEVWRKPIDQATWDAYREAEKAIMVGRDPHTGY